MTTQVQFRRGTTVQHAAFTGAVGEVTVDTDKKVAVVHDGATAGGQPLGKEIEQRTTAQLASYTGAAGEIGVNTDLWSLVVHDGATAGGVPLARSSDLLVEIADLTNGGANNLTEYALSHTLEDGYRYFLQGRRISSSAGNWLPALQFQTLGGSFRTGASDYYRSGQTNSGTPSGFNSDAGTEIVLYQGATLDAPRYLSFFAEIVDARVAAAPTNVVWDSHAYSVTSATRAYGSGAVGTAEENDAVRITLGGTDQFDSGVMLLWRIQDPS